MTTDKEQQLFAQFKEFIGFGAQDAERLQSLGPLFAQHGREITDTFYERLLATPETAPLIQGRVEKLKDTHMKWMASLFQGEYGPGYLTERWRIGLTHVRVGIPPWWVEAVTSFLRDAGLGLIAANHAGASAAALCQSYVKILDVDLWIINLAYNEERLVRLTTFTGMSRKLIERCVLQGK